MLRSFTSTAYPEINNMSTQYTYKYSRAEGCIDKQEVKRFFLTTGYEERLNTLGSI